MNKKIYFLCGLPRSGNTLLGSILNQNSKINVTANTILTDIIYQLHLQKKFEIYKNFPDERSLNNIIKNVFNNYYENWKGSFIIDRGPWGTPDNLKLLKTIIKKPKFIILYRPVLECLASFIKIEKPDDIEQRCFELISDEGMIGKNLNSIKNIIYNDEDYLFINYLDLVKNTKIEIQKIYKFLNIDYFNHSFKNLNQFKVNDIKYNDSVLSTCMHKIRTKDIKINKYKIENYLPKKIIDEYI